MQFRNRAEAGRHLAKKLGRYARNQNVVVLALPRGGVPVGFEVANELEIPLGIFLVRKLGVPWQPEFAMGALASGGVTFINDDVTRQLRISPEEIRNAIHQETEELDRRTEFYGREFSETDVSGKVVILVDDGLATGATTHVAVNALKQRNPERIVVAVPVASDSACELLRDEVVEIVCVQVPENFSAVGQRYEDFSQTSDEEVRELLLRTSERFHPSSAAAPLHF